MPWFIEIEELIKLGTLRRESLFRGIFFWALDAIQDYTGLTGPLVHVANRRRIWEACEDIALTYYNNDVKRAIRTG
ncbi:hypothetical protein F4813DRAFT_354521 [Daldinia decipiens]|uniref:uncharacterized protein n=1 Tax=Daldinia decipiens TaxID=326647 RepID=UPI0020C3D1BC|nr:uncharacterized protein F4813DRAFT_354521 [Daldinia decipiens]KAI1659302.1 hypothetical protein F4813DRAFT_354521 [Daldinia decipiens]